MKRHPPHPQWTLTITRALQDQLCTASVQTGFEKEDWEIAELAVTDWLARNVPNAIPMPKMHGYQWKQLFLPDGTVLRTKVKIIIAWCRTTAFSTRERQPHPTNSLIHLVACAVTHGVLCGCCFRARWSGNLRRRCASMSGRNAGRQAQNRGREISGHLRKNTAPLRTKIVRLRVKIVHLRPISVPTRVKSCVRVHFGFWKPLTGISLGSRPRPLRNRLPADGSGITRCIAVLKHPDIYSTDLLKLRRGMGTCGGNDRTWAAPGS